MKNKHHIIQSLSHYQPVLLPETPLSAAVMILLLINETNEIEIVLTKRSSTLPTYAGHYSFPGGMRDIEDTDLYITAVREIQEELNISVNTYERIGQLDDFIDHFGNLVRPFVTVMEKEIFEQSYKISPVEIDEIYYFSLNKLKQIQDEPKLHPVTRRRPSYAFSEGNVFVWGLTATILVQFFNVITGENKSLGKRITTNK